MIEHEQEQENPWLKRFFWFVAIWALSVVSLDAFSHLLRILT